jgi:hypothetical protein
MLYLASLKSSCSTHRVPFLLLALQILTNVGGDCDRACCAVNCRWSLPTSRPDDGNSNQLCNVRQLLTDCTAQDSRRHSQPWEFVFLPKYFIFHVILITTELFSEANIPSSNQKCLAFYRTWRLIFVFIRTSHFSSSSADRSSPQLHSISLVLILIWCFLVLLRPCMWYLSSDFPAKTS